MIKELLQKTFVLKMGGSVFAPNGNDRKRGVDIQYLDKFEKFIRKQVAKKRRFFIVTGGGHTCREYQEAAAKTAGVRLEDEDLDWLGVHASRLNAHLFRTIFRDIAYERILKHYDMVDKKAKQAVVVCAGWKPGWSTDYCSVLVANDYDIKTVINMTDTDYVYDKDPDKFKKAKPIKKMSWNELIGIVGSEWDPGMNAPFDPVASRMARKIGLKVIVSNGRDLKNLERILDGEEYKGTVIE